MRGKKASFAALYFVLRAPVMQIERTAYYLCKRDQLDARKRIRGQRVY
jgi:hypothetical protein